MLRDPYVLDHIPFQGISDFVDYGSPARQFASVYRASKYDNFLQAMHIYSFRRCAQKNVRIKCRQLSPPRVGSLLINHVRQNIYHSEQDLPQYNFHSSFLDDNLHNHQNLGKYFLFRQHHTNPPQVP